MEAENNEILISKYLTALDCYTTSMVYFKGLEGVVSSRQVLELPQGKL